MKLTNRRLKRIIREEKQKIVKESVVDLDDLQMTLANALPGPGKIDIKELMHIVASTLVMYSGWSPQEVAKGMGATIYAIDKGELE